MFTGMTHHTMDCKGRIVLPQKYRDELGESFCITYGFPSHLGKKYRCIQIMSHEEFERLRIQIKAMPAKSALALQYVVVAPASDVSPNTQGRIQIPQALREGINLGKELVVLGMDTRIEVWDRELYAEFNELNMEISSPDAMEFLQL